MQPRHSAPGCSSSLPRARVTARGEHNVAQQVPGATRVSVQSASAAHGASSAPPFCGWAGRSPPSESPPLPRERVQSSCAFSAASAAVIGRDAAGAGADAEAGAGGAEAAARGAGCSVALVWLLADAQASANPSATAAQVDLTSRGCAGTAPAVKAGDPRFALRAARCRGSAGSPLPGGRREASR